MNHMSTDTQLFARKEKILVALSDISLATLISQALLQEGYENFVVKNGQEALDQMKIKQPDLLLIDLIMPGKNGYEILTEKSFDRMITKIPVIIVSNTGAPIEMRKIPSTSSVKDYIIKAHVDVDDVIEKIALVFGYPARKEITKEDKNKSVGLGKVILWVEDDKFLSTILLKKFESSGYKVIKADNGDQALEMIQSTTPNVIVLDILLPGLSGFEILQKIHIQDKFKTIPVIMLSNMSKPSDLEKAKMLGVQKFLVKAAVSLDQIVKEIAILVK